MKSINAIVIAALFLAGSVTAEETNRFAIYYWSYTCTGDVQNAILSPNPVLTENDIISYDWPTHTMDLTKEGAENLPTMQQVGTGGKQFVVVADGQRCYLGAFWIGLSSIGHLNPVIDVAFRSSSVTIHRRFPYPAKEAIAENDPRSDKRILKVLTELGKVTNAPN